MSPDDLTEIEPFFPGGVTNLQLEKPIFDIGMHDGLDAAFYMHKGFRVVSVEANPALCERARKQFAEQIRSGQLTILNVAIADEEGERDFYINLHDDHWSSLDPEWGQRTGKFETIKVRTQRFDSLFATYGVPIYLKIDIEGGDLTVLRQLRNCTAMPRFISVEEHDLSYFPLLWSLGYRGFKIINQGLVQSLDYPGWKFPFGTSGPFGNETQGQWLPFGDAIMQYMLNIRDCRDKAQPTASWFDIHATLDETALPENHPYPRGPSRIRSIARRIRQLRGGSGE
jgi:FkbM family methyltransferase